MAVESDLEKAEPPSSRRLEQARAAGQVPQSREPTAFLVMAAARAGAAWAAAYVNANSAGPASPGTPAAALVVLVLSNAR